MPNHAFLVYGMDDDNVSIKNTLREGLSKISIKDFKKGLEAAGSAAYLIQRKENA
jgi:uncharacterized protein YvpB